MNKKVLPPSDCDVVITTTIGALPKTVIKVECSPNIDFTRDFVKSILSKDSSIPSPDRIDWESRKITWYIESTKRLEICERVSTQFELLDLKVYKQYPDRAGWQRVANFLEFAR